MSDKNKATVLQGRLGWESGDISEAKPSELEPHPKNTDIYGDTEDPGDLDETFKTSVSEKGVLEPLVVTNGKLIISGHRRWLAAKDADLSSVPVRYAEFDTGLEEREALIEFNRQRDKTPGQIVNEFDEMLEIEKKVAKKRKEELTKGNLENVGGGKISTSDEDLGKARDIAAKKVNASVSGKTLEKGKFVKDKARSDEDDSEITEIAKQAWDGLSSGSESFDSAYQKVKTARNKREKEEKRRQRQEEFTRQIDQDDAIQIDSGDFEETLSGKTGVYDHIITDPPYDKDALREWEKLSKTAADVLVDGGLLIAYSGTYHLDDVFDALNKHLEYYWQCIVVHADTGSRVWPRNIRTNYKPILIFAKPPVEKLEGLAHDVIEGKGREKDDHEWQQALDESETLIETLTEPNDLILDPMCGSGTTGVAALKKQRRVHLIDRDPDALDSARKRCSDVL
jgi:ParB-like chromosome segregation protein Spo0J